MRHAPCTWPLAGPDDCDAVARSGHPDKVKAAAVSLLWNWTGRTYGICDVTVRPCRRDCDPRSTYHDGQTFGLHPQLVAGEWRNLACGVCGDRCGCRALRSVVLPGPVHTVTEVQIDGAVVDPAAYRVDGWRRLVRHDGDDWPACQNLNLPAGAEGTWTVEYEYGTPVPEGGQIAAGVLACEIAKALVGSRDCQLPERVQTVTREGVTVALLDSFEGLERGRTGVFLVDSWVQSVTGAPRPARVVSPDRPGPARTTYQGA